MHSANEDIKWLQKDFHIFVANLFDTAIALKLMRYPHSLAFCVEHFCGIKLQKQHQMADWRIRPLPSELITYARSDTHYLLYCYNRIKVLLRNYNESKSGNALVVAITDSNRLSRYKYQRPQFDTDLTYSIALNKSINGLSIIERDLAKNIFNWRDNIARINDESPHQVLKNHLILQLIIVKPKTLRDLQKIVNPCSSFLIKNVKSFLNLFNADLDENMDLSKLPLCEKLDIQEYQPNTCMIPSYFHNEKQSEETNLLSLKPNCMQIN